MEKSKTCFFTGHRDIPQIEIERIEQKTAEYIDLLCKEGYDTFICGGAVGFDTVAAREVLKKRESADIKLYLYIPCENQDRYFDESQKEEYLRIRSLADGEKVLYPKYVRGCMHARNRKMADDSSVCIAYCTSDTGGTAYTVKYAEKSMIRILKV